MVDARWLRLTRAVAVLVSLVMTGWVSLAYLSYAGLAYEFGDRKPLVAMAAAVGVLAAAAIVARRRGARASWMIFGVGLVALGHLLAWYL